MAEIKKGDVVRLKSGGPKMTVEEVGDYGPLGPENGAKCTWFEGNKHNSNTFAVETLEPASDGPRQVLRG